MTMIVVTIAFVAVWLLLMMWIAYRWKGSGSSGMFDFSGLFIFGEVVIFSLLVALAYAIAWAIYFACT